MAKRERTTRGTASRSRCTAWEQILLAGGIELELVGIIWPADDAACAVAGQDLLLDEDPPPARTAARSRCTH